MTSYEDMNRHPFVLESFYRETAALTTDGDLSDPERVLEPLIELYLNQRDAMVSSTYQNSDPDMLSLLESEKDKPWWRLMPIMLPPYRSNHDFALTYAVYRQMSTGNMVFKMGRELSTALFNTDFKIKMDQLHFPSDTFVIYYHDATIPVYGKPLKWLFCDRIDYIGGLKEIRIVYGFIDDDGDYANSGFFLYTYQPDIEVSSDELFAQMEKKTVSTLSLNAITDEHRQNSRNVLTALFNFLLYVGTVGDQVIVQPNDYLSRLSQLKNPKKKRRMEKEVANSTIYRYTYVGRNYEARVADKNSDSGISNLTHRVLVRGHWRHQWTGSQRDSNGERMPGTSQKLIWIEPYWKGPDTADDKVTVRVVR